MSTRPDLAVLTDDDLIALSNRGTVKRAVRELADDSLEHGLEASPDGTVRLRWSDGPRCTFPGGATVRDAECSCAATGVCRHLIRSVLAYQAGVVAGDATPAPAPWSPGEIADDSLARHFGPAALAAARKRYTAGLVIEVVRGAKPLARLESESLCVRFQVEGDVRYTHCDCAEAPPCSHVPLAVWAFRELAPGEGARLVSTARRAHPVPEGLLTEVDGSLAEMVTTGFGKLQGAWRDRVARLAQRAADEDLPWPGAVLADIVDAFDRYHAHDARFSPERLAGLLGEWTARRRAMTSQAPAVAQLLVRGTRSDRTVELAATRLVGLGCHGRIAGGEAELTAFFQDTDSGTLAAFVRAFPDPAPEEAQPRMLADLARRRVARGATLAGLGGGQLLISGARRRPDRSLVFARKPMTVSPQNFAWDRLKSPVLAEGFGQIRAHLATLPPPALRPRRITDSLFVCPVAAVEDVGFDRLGQSVVATLLDENGERADLVHPFYARAADGAELLLEQLRTGPGRMRWLAGCVRSGGVSLRIEPTAVVFEHEDGSRFAVQPWVDGGAGAAKRAAAACEVDDGAPRQEEADYLHALRAALGDVCVVGLRDLDPRLVAELARHGEAAGFVRIAARVAVLGEELERKTRELRWDADRAARAAVELAMWAELSRDLG